MSVSKILNKNGNKMTVTFYVKKEAVQGANKIYLICEHNGWEPVALKPQKNGTFRTTITVPTNVQKSFQYRYKYVMPNEQVKFDNDWDAEAYTPNPFSGDNSVFNVIERA